MNEMVSWDKDYEKTRSYPYSLKVETVESDDLKDINDGYLAQEIPFSPTTTYGDWWYWWYNGQTNAKSPITTNPQQQ